jgi:hypothetical protein
MQSQPIDKKPEERKRVSKFSDAVNKNLDYNQKINS